MDERVWSLSPRRSFRHQDWPIWLMSIGNYLNEHLTFSLGYWIWKINKVTRHFFLFLEYAIWLLEYPIILTFWKDLHCTHMAGGVGLQTFHCYPLLSFENHLKFLLTPVNFDGLLIKLGPKNFLSFWITSITGNWSSSSHNIVLPLGTVTLHKPLNL